ncbi:MAG: 2-succinyl-5-enolpyruvyl-6-hydroxy-3-cyclohexene-1-carboxylic-acid synthase [Anaerolineae bacterium]|nr:2-succinyl-5-enolpyruvyl-6-hydroxy-3-cyclohexene-1-carboxylic-acid synthase [Anaerolineae bacterium]
MANRNTVWASIFVDELARCGLKTVCAAPGSRHTPLMLAVAKHPDIKVYSHLDERSASFFALGLALASNKPVALICTSGTAGANMYPAIIEAHQSRVPLIVITADRPPELRHSGANQTIDQIKMFGDFVLWFVDMALPEANPPAVAIRNLRTTANRAYAKANGIRKGVVHLNMPFRKPLEPTEVEGDIVEVPLGAEAREGGRSFAGRSLGLPSMISGNWIRDIVHEYNNGFIIAGRRVNQRDGGYGLLDLSKVTGYPLIADIDYKLVSVLKDVPKPIRGFETFGSYLNNLIQPPDAVIRIGDLPLSAQLNNYITTHPPKFYLHITESGGWSDDSHLVTAFAINTEQWAVNKFLERGEYELQPKREIHPIYAIEQTTWETINHEIETGQYFDGAVVYDVVDLIPAESTLFAGNSLPVRHLDQFGKPQDKRIYTYANRGASGIDGNISSALGAGAARPNKPLVAILGDITFYHDMNGLLAVQRCGVPITIVLLNNGGGGIFNRLPIRDFEPEFTDYFLTPHGLDFSHTAKMYGLDFVSIDAYSKGARDSFRQAFTERVSSDKSTIIEVRTNSRQDEVRRQEIIAAVHARLQELKL